MNREFPVQHGDFRDSALLKPALQAQSKSGILPTKHKKVPVSLCCAVSVDRLLAGGQLK